MKHTISCIFLICICLQLFAQPANDGPCGATALAVGSACSLQASTTVGASNSAGIPAPPCAASGKDVWFSITVPASGMFTIETSAGTIVDGILAVYTGTCTGLAYAYCDDDSGPGTMPMLDLQGFIPGSTVYIRFYKKGGGTGTFSICVWDNNPPLEANNDCGNAQQLCTEASFSSNSLGEGDVDDLNASNKGCLTPNEHASSWYYFTMGSNGELTFTITPDNPTDNFNFAIWGPNPTCPLTNDPLRCSNAATSGETGMELGSTDLTEGTPGDGWTKFIDVVAGETYILMIDNYSDSGEGFEFDFDGPPTISCAAYLLPINLINFEGYADGSENVLNWTVSSQNNNQWFVIERSFDAQNFIEMVRINGDGTLESEKNYTIIDNAPIPGEGYYRIKQIDYNGNSSISNVISVVNNQTTPIVVMPTISNGTFNVVFQTLPGSLYQLEVVDQLGNRQLACKQIAENDITEKQIYIREKGMHLIIVYQNGIAQSQKVIVQ